MGEQILYYLGLITEEIYDILKCPWQAEMLYGASSKHKWENHRAELQDFGGKLHPLLQILVLL